MTNADDMNSLCYLLAPTFQFTNSAGKPLTEGWMEVYISGTRDKYYCYSDWAGTLHPFQIPLDSLGANIVLADPSQAYDVYVYNKFGSLIMSRYHVFPSHGGGSSVLNITISSEDGTVTVINDGNGNFDLSIKDTVNRLDLIEQAVSGIVNESFGYAIGHAYTVNLDNTINLINDVASGINYTQDMNGFRLTPGHVYQFNYNAKFSCGENDRTCSGKFYLEGPNSIAQEWLFDLDDTYYHSQSFNGSTVLVIPGDLPYYDVKLKYAWDSAYTNPPDIDLNKISIVDVTTLLSTTVSGVGGNYTGGDGIFVNNETNIISVDMGYINEHLDIDATEIIASAVNVATGYTNVTVSAVSGELVDLINEVSASIPDAQVQSDWTETDTSSKAYIQNKPNETTLCAGTNISIEVSGTSAIISSSANSDVTMADLISVSGTLNNKIETVSASIPDVSNYATITEVNTVSGILEGHIQTVSAAIPDVSSFITSTQASAIVGAVSSVIENDIPDTSDMATKTWVGNQGYLTSVPSQYATDAEVASAIATAIASVPAQVQSDWTESDSSSKSYIKNKPDNYNLVAGDNIDISVSGTNIIVSASGTDLSNYATHSEVSAVSGNLVELVNQVSASVPAAQVNADWTAVSGKAEILNKPQEHELVAGPGVSIAASGNNYVISAVVTGSPVLSGYVTEVELETVSGNIVNLIPDISGLATNEDLQIVSAAIPDISGLATKQEVSSASGILQTEIEVVSGNIPTDYVNLVAGDNIGISVSGTNIIISASGTDPSSYATRTEVNTVSGVLEGQIQTVSAAIPDVSNFATETQVIAVSGTLQTEVTAISGIVSTLPTAVPGIVAGSGIDVTASGNDYIISCTVTGGGETYNAGDYIGISDNTISVTGITDLVAGNAITITASGNSAIISSTGEAQVQSDWNVTDSNSKAYIKNKPTIPAAQVQSNWNETNTSSKAYIQNKPTIHTYTGASGISISSDVVTLDNPIGLVAVSGIEITVSGTSAIISASGIMDVLGDVETALANL